jgi:hypothetical protein
VRVFSFSIFFLFLGLQVWWCCCCWWFVCVVSGVLCVCCSIPGGRDFVVVGVVV